MNWIGPCLNLKITTLLLNSTSIAEQDRLPLDGLLEWAASQTTSWEKFSSPPCDDQIDWYTESDVLCSKGVSLGNERNPINHELPLEMEGDRSSPFWYWKASSAHFPTEMETDRTHYHRRFDITHAQLEKHVDLEGKAGKFLVAGCRYKMKRTPMLVKVVPSVEWYCRGWIIPIASLLSRVTHVGKGKSQGFGEVIRWEIHRMENDWSCWKEGKPTRPLPFKEGDFSVRYGGLRPPYWHTSRNTRIIVPD